MTEPRVMIRFDENGRVYRPGDTLAGQYRMAAVEREAIRAVEISVLWYTDGKGDEDLGVHHFRRLSAEQGDCTDPRRPARFAATLPASPLSYDGLIVKVRWCVRVRVFLKAGKEVVGERLFRLGEVRTAKAVPV